MDCKIEALLVARFVALSISLTQRVHHDRQARFRGTRGRSRSIQRPPSTPRSPRGHAARSSCSSSQVGCGPKAGGPRTATAERWCSAPAISEAPPTRPSSSASRSLATVRANSLLAVSLWTWLLTACLSDYPVNSLMALSDGTNEMAVAIDTSVGGASMADGQLELMVHRRLQKAQRGGLNPLNETM